MFNNVKRYQLSVQFLQKKANVSIKDVPLRHCKVTKPFAWQKMKRNANPRFLSFASLHSFLGMQHSIRFKVGSISPISNGKCLLFKLVSGDQRYWHSNDILYVLFCKDFWKHVIKTQSFKRIQLHLQRFIISENFIKCHLAHARAVLSNEGLMKKFFINSTCCNHSITKAKRFPSSQSTKNDPPSSSTLSQELSRVMRVSLL